MRETITVRLDKDVGRLLARVVAPFAEAQGLLTDEDVFKLVS